MPTIKIQVGKSVILFLAAVTLFTACAPPGPRALLRGQKLLEQGKYAEAVEKLQQATVLLGNTNAQAFNYLGLACHHAGQVQEAEKAYQRALVLNPDLAEARYNLGCLWLEENKFEQAKAELTAFTLRRSNSPEGWLRLGTAQLRASEAASGYVRTQELIAAEKSFTQALHLNSQAPETLTGLGLVRLRRGNPAEAAQWFERALNEQADYPPALLNLAIVEQEYLNNPGLALQNYEKYLAVKPLPEDAGAVQSIVRQLQASVAAQAGHLLPTNHIVQHAASTTPTNPATGPRPAPALDLSTNQVRVAKATVSEPDKALPKTNSAQPAKAPLGSNALRTAIPSSTAQPPGLVVETVPSEPIIKPAQDSAPANTSTLTTGSVEAPAPLSSGQGTPSAHNSKRTLLQRLNPASLFAGDPKPQASTIPQTTSLATSVNSSAAPATAQSAPVQEAQLTVPRYHYQSPAKPAAGRRADAERAFAQAVQAHEAHKLPEAIQGYRRAGQLDPSFFDVQFNLGVAAGEAGNLPLALTAYEEALAIRPASLDARYNFALVLKQAGYWLDAANELEKLLNFYPSDSRSHLALGNLLAQQLHQPAKAREHYLKVLETDPRNPEAASIRYWLTASPQ